MGLNDTYARLALPTASRSLALARGERMSALERRLRAIEQKAPEVNLEPEAVHLAAEIAALQPDLDDDARFVLILLVVITLAAAAQGSTRFPAVGQAAIEPMRRMLEAFKGCADGLDRDAVRAAIERMLADGLAPQVIGRSPTDRLPLLFLDPFVTHQRLHAMERRIAERIHAMRSAAAFGASRVADAIQDVTGRPAVVGGVRIEFSGEQLKAVETAARSRLALISGGPGTGKTSIVVAILRVLARLGVSPDEIALCAPTGRAAFRMRESMATAMASVEDPSAEDLRMRESPPASATVHRLLGYSPERRSFMHHRNNPLGARVVVVDESSMLDLTLMERLVGALGPSAQLVLLGDADQLPSVAAGAAFRDLTPADRSHPLFECAVRLTRNYRTRTDDPAGAAIVELCRRINAGDAGAEGSGAVPPPIVLRSNPDQIEFKGVEMLGSTQRLDEFLERWERECGSDRAGALAAREYTIADGSFGAKDREQLADLFECRTRARILCLTRTGATGSDALNGWMHRRALRSIAAKPRAAALVAGEPIVVTRNDYERGLFNGDQGVVVNVRDAGGRRFAAAVFSRDDGFAAFRIEALHDLIELAYATTVHKAQGSEFDVAALILPERDMPLLTRELLYTAVSRCRRGTVIVGDPALLALGISRKADRFSGLAEELNARAKPARPDKPMQLAMNFAQGSSERKRR